MGCLNAPQGPNAFVPYMVQMLSNMAEGMVKTGRDWHAIERADEILKEVGFVDIDFTYQGTYVPHSLHSDNPFLLLTPRDVMNQQTGP